VNAPKEGGFPSPEKGKREKKRERGTSSILAFKEVVAANRGKKGGGQRKRELILWRNRSEGRRPFEKDELFDHATRKSFRWKGRAVAVAPVLRKKNPGL